MTAHLTCNYFLSFTPMKSKIFETQKFVIKFGTITTAAATIITIIKTTVIAIVINGSGMIIGNGMTIRAAVTTAACLTRDLRTGSRGSASTPLSTTIVGELYHLWFSNPHSTGSQSAASVLL